MKRWLLLTNEELKRSTKLLVLLISGLIVAEIASLLYQIYDYQSTIEKTMRIEQISEMDAIARAGGALTFAQATDFYDSIIVLAMGMIILFAFWIWYRDWIGETKYIYRLLLLPGSRRAIFGSKMTALLLVVTSLIGIQWGLLLLSRNLYLWLLPDAQQITASINEYSIYMKLFYTMYPSDILFILLMTFIVISFVFMTVLLERSFRKGKSVLARRITWDCVDWRLYHFGLSIVSYFERFESTAHAILSRVHRALNVICVVQKSAVSPDASIRLKEKSHETISSTSDLWSDHSHNNRKLHRLHAVDQRSRLFARDRQWKIIANRKF